MTTEELFWAYVDVSGDCWEWQGARSGNGYGAFKIGGVQVTAHRCAYAFHFGKVPADLYVLHRCDNRACCNPAHLWVGTQGNNMRDMVVKGRLVVSRGERNGASKLTWDDVRSIRALYRQGGTTQDRLALDFGVSQTAIGFIVRNEHWVEA